ncbi:MAG: PilZ domain-containing protein [Desulfosarcinaceae bacterium]|nr:PilZ domain-containing protein [Desulfosarcinaceae bacterium]
MFFKRRNQNKRRHPRKAYGAPITITYDNDSYSCVLNDISKGGAFLGIEAGHQIRPGAFIDINIPFTDRGKFVKKVGKVTRVDKQGIGVRFIA